jgi:multidrug resistance efflux pump
MAEVISGDSTQHLCHSADPRHSTRGVVQGVGKAIYQPLGSGGGELAAVPPSLDWVQLAQRFSVRIILKKTHECNLHSGSTATVWIDPTQQVGLTEDGILQP